MNSYTENKRAKDTKLCQMITKTLTKDRRENSYSKEEQAEELGLNVGTLSNKLKTSCNTSDVTLSEFIHLLEITGNYGPLEYLNNMFDMQAIPKKASINIDTTKISIFADNAQLESNDVYSSAKRALEDGVITHEEKIQILKELEESEKATATLKASVFALKIEDEE